MMANNTMRLGRVRYWGSGVEEGVCREVWGEMGVGGVTRDLDIWREDVRGVAKRYLEAVVQAEARDDYKLGINLMKKLEVAMEAASREGYGETPVVPLGSVLFWVPVRGKTLACKEGQLVVEGVKSYDDRVDGTYIVVRGEDDVLSARVYPRNRGAARSEEEWRLLPLWWRALLLRRWLKWLRERAESSADSQTADWQREEVKYWRREEGVAEGEVMNDEVLERIEKQVASRAVQYRKDAERRYVSDRLWLRELIDTWRAGGLTASLEERALADVRGCCRIAEKGGMMIWLPRAIFGLVKRVLRKTGVLLVPQLEDEHGAWNLNGNHNNKCAQGVLRGGTGVLTVAESVFRSWVTWGNLDLAETNPDGWSGEPRWDVFLSGITQKYASWMRRGLKGVDLGGEDAALEVVRLWGCLDLFWWGKHLRVLEPFALPGVIGGTGEVLWSWRLAMDESGQKQPVVLTTTGERFLARGERVVQGERRVRRMGEMIVRGTVGVLMGDGVRSPSCKTMWGYYIDSSYRGWRGRLGRESDVEEDEPLRLWASEEVGHEPPTAIEVRDVKRSPAVQELFDRDVVVEASGGRERPLDQEFEGDRGAEMNLLWEREKSLPEVKVMYNEAGIGVGWFVGQMLDESAQAEQHE